METIIIGRKDVCCSIESNNECVAMLFHKLPVPCYGQNRGANNYKNNIKLIYTLGMDICSENLKSLYHTHTAIKANKEIIIADCRFLISNNEKSIKTMKEWFENAIKVMKDKLNKESV